MKITNSFFALAVAASAALSGCVDPDADVEADLDQTESELAGDICFTFYEHVNFNSGTGGATYSGCVSPGGPRCANILGFMDNRESSFTHSGTGIQLFDGAACSGTLIYNFGVSSDSNLHDNGAGDRATSARFFPL